VSASINIILLDMGDRGLSVRLYPLLKVFPEPIKGTVRTPAIASGC